MPNKNNKMWQKAPPDCQTKIFCANFFKIDKFDSFDTIKCRLATVLWETWAAESELHAPVTTERSDGHEN